MKKKNLLQHSVVPACVATLALLTSRSTAANLDTWNGGASPNGNWTTANNWGGVAPVANDFLFFDGASQLLSTNNFTAGTIFGNLTFNPSASSFVLSGNSLVLTNGLDGGLGGTFGGSITNSSPNAQTINNPITLSAGKHFITTDGGGQLNLNGPITRNTGAVVQFAPANGAINVTGGLSTNGQNNIIGGWAILGNDWATLDASSNVVAFAGYTDVTGAPTIANDPTSNVRWGSDTGNATVASGTTIINSLLSQTAARSVTIPTGSTLKLGSRGGIYRNSLASGTLTIAPVSGTAFLTANGGGEITILAQPNTASGSVVVSANITNDSPANPVSVNVYGYITLNGNSYSGGTYINQGRVTYNASGAYGFGPVYVYPGGETFQSAANCTNALFLSGIGSVETSVGNAGPGALRLSGRTQSGKVTLLGSTRITTSSTSDNTILSGQITGTGPLELATFATSGSHIVLANAGTASDWTGGLYIDSLVGATSDRAVTVKLGANNQIPDGATAGDVTINGANYNAILDLNGFSDTINGLSATNNTRSQVINAGSAPATLTIGNNNASGTFGGSFSDSGTLNRLSLVKMGSGTETFTGPNTRVGDTTVNGGTLVIGLGSSIASCTNLIVNSNATLNVTAVCPVTQVGVRGLTSSNGTWVVALQGVGGAITTPALTSIGATNFITIASIPTILAYPAQFPAIKYTTLNGTLNFGLAGALPVSPGAPYAGYVSNNVANGSVDFVVTAGPVSVKWAGNDGTSLNSAWDVNSTTTWRNGGGSPVVYLDGEFALFDDTAVNAIVSLNQSLAPAGVTVTNATLTYTNIGSGKITGGGSLSKQGGGTLVLDNFGGNDFTGGVAINGGTIQIGDNDTGGNLPAGGAVLNNGALVYKRTDTVTESSLISGSGTLTQNGNGTLDLTSANTYTGAVTVVKGTLQVDNNTALGTTNGGTTVASGATLAIVNNAINMGQERITISGSGVGGNGALVNNSGNTTFVTANAARVIMAGDATVGGSGRFDLRSATTGDSSLSSLSTGGQAYKLTKVGGVAFGLIGCTVDPQLGNIDVQQGILSIEAATTGLGNPASTISVFPGATFQMFAATNQLNKQFNLGGDGTATFTVSATSGAGNTIIGPMNITNDCNFSVNNAAVALMLSNTISGPGRLIKVGLGLLTIAGNSPAYTGGILQSAGNVTLTGTLSNNLGVTVSLGKFALNGTLLGNGLTNAANTTVVGSGVSTGPVDIAGNLNPGDTNVFGTLTVGGLNLESGAVLNYDLFSKNTPGGGTNDLIVVNGDLIVNGTSIIINPVGLLKTGAGNSYRLFNYTGNLIVNSDFQVSCPVNYTFAVDTNTPGQVNLVLGGGPPVWNGGSSTGNNWTDSANWGGVAIAPGNELFFDGTTRRNNTNDEPADTSFSDIAFNTDAGAFILNGNQVNLGGNLINFSTNAQTIRFGMDFNANRTFTGGTGTGSLIIGGGLTNTASTTVTLAGNGIITNLIGSADSTTMTNIFSVVSNANWSLMDNPASIPISTSVQLDILAGTFTFGQGSSAPSLYSTASGFNSRVGVTVGAPAVFNMNSGSLTLTARLNTGAAANSVATINQTGGALAVGLMQSSDGSANALTTMNFTGGAFTSTNFGTPNSYSAFYVSSRGTGVVTVASSAVVACSTLDLARNAAGNTSGSIGTVNLNGGGTLVCSRVGTATSAAQSGPPSAGPAPAATFNFNGGTLRANASSTTFYQGNASAPAIPITSIVKSGGAIIDSGTNAISVLEPLQHDATLGGTQDGGLTKQGAGTLTLTAASTYTGNTTVSGGTLVVNGTLGVTAVTVANTATLSGTGSMGSNVTVNAGGTIAPATVGTLGILTVASNVVLSGTANMDINATTLTNDVVKAGGITYGGALTVTNVSGSPAAGNSFKLFTAPSITGSFTATNLPALNPGLGWNWNPATATLSVIQTVNTNPTNLTAVVSGSTLTLSWPADHTGWRLQVQTNSLGSGLNPATNAWFTVPGSTSVNSVNATLDAHNGTVFYRMVYP